MKRETMKALLCLTICLLVQGCASSRYETRFISISSSPTLQADDAMAICVPRAKAEGDLAYTRAAQNSGGSAGGSVTCNSTGNLSGGGTYTGSTNCVSDGKRQESIIEFNERLNLRDSVRNASLVGCLASYGWRVERVCVKNCRQ